MNNFVQKLIKHPFFVNFVLAIVVTIVLIFLTLKWLDSYTHHNESVVVPDVKGLQTREAAEFFKSNQLSFSVVDSVYSSDVSPGAIVDVIPATGSKVKEGRIIFVTVNATSSKKGEIPDVEDVSFRQAQALLLALGFESVEISYVSGTYKDLAIGITLNGKMLTPGALIPLNAPIRLLVSDGGSSSNADSLSTANPTPIDSEEETWF